MDDKAKTTIHGKKLTTKKKILISFPFFIAGGALFTSFFCSISIACIFTGILILLTLMGMCFVFVIPNFFKKKR